MSRKRKLLDRHFRSLTKRVVLLFVLLWATMLMSGCNIIAWGAQAFRDDDKPIPVEAVYTDLADKRVAVMVAADDQTLYRFPRSTYRVGEVVSRGIQTNVPGVAVTLPREIEAFQQRNPAWITVRPSRLMDQLGVDRLVIIDINEYRTNEPGNINVWKGKIDATVALHESDSEVPDNRVLEQTVVAGYPEGTEFGLIREHAQEGAVEQAMLKTFTLRAAGLFYDHEEMPVR